MTHRLEKRNSQISGGLATLNLEGGSREFLEVRCTILGHDQHPEPFEGDVAFVCKIVGILGGQEQIPCEVTMSQAIGGLQCFGFTQNKK